MKKGFFDKRIPTVFAILILLGGLAITTLIIKEGTLISSKASPQQEPQDIHVVNVTDTTFTVMFTTASPTVGAVSVVNTAPPRLVYDKRDSSGQKKFVSHFITVTNLKPQTIYKFNIISDGDSFLDQGKPYSITTIPKASSQPPETVPIAGSILLPDATPGNDVLVYITAPEGKTAGAITDNQGNYKLASAYLINKTTFEPLALEPNAEIEIEAKKSSAASKILYKYQPGQTIPAITLSQNYTFNATIQSDESLDTSSLLALPTLIPNASQELTITTPIRNQAFTDSRPQFRGGSAPSSTIRIVIEGEQNIEAQVRSDRNGNWAFRPSTVVLPGEHTITAESTDSSGTLQNVSTIFQIFPSGSQIAESATGSATLTPTKTLTVTIPVATSSPTPLPTTIASASPIIVTATPTITPFITVTLPPASIPPKATIPPTGNATTTIMLTTLSILFIVAGSAFLFIL